MQLEALSLLATKSLFPRGACPLLFLAPQSPPLAFRCRWPYVFSDFSFRTETLQLCSSTSGLTSSPELQIFERISLDAFLALTLTCTLPRRRDLSFLDGFNSCLVSSSLLPVSLLNGSLFKLVRVNRSRGISSFTCSSLIESQFQLIHCTAALSFHPAYARTPNFKLHDLHNLTNDLSGYFSRCYSFDLLVFTSFDFGDLESWCPNVSCFLSGFIASSRSCVNFLVSWDFLYSRPQGTCF